MKQMLKKQMKGVPEEQQEKIFAMVEKNPDFFMKIAKEVQDKMSNGMSQQDATMAVMREGKEMSLESMKEIAFFYEKTFVKDLKSLNISLPDVMPRASENIDADIAIIKKLENNNFRTTSSRNRW
jgi:cysteinyl-tRNA synthetase